MASASPSAQDRRPSSNSTNRSPTRNSTTTSPAGMQRSARGAAGGPVSTARPGGSIRSGAGHVKRASRVFGEETTIEAAALIEELKAQLRKAEDASTEYQKQLYVAQTQLDEARNEQIRMEEVTHSYMEKLTTVEKSYDEATKSHREEKERFEDDRSTLEREKEQAHAREDELQGTVQKLKDSLAAHRERDGEGLLSRSASFRGRSSPRPTPESPLARRDSSQSSSSNLILQKDKVIEGLRLELAEAQIKLVEMENAGGGHLQELEKLLLEARMSNAKLLEDNESYQVLLSEKTLNGDFSKSDLLGVHGSDTKSLSRKSSRDPTSGSLADELSTADGSDGGEEHEESSGSRKARKLQGELDAMKDQNKALTLYINKIISRLLASEQFEKLFADGTMGDLDSDVMGRNKELPPTPADSGPSLLQRAGSIFGGRKGGRPTSVAGANELAPPTSGTDANISISKRRSMNVTEDPTTAPSIPVQRRSASTRGALGGRSHRRTNSDWSANVVNNMYRGPSPGASSGTPLSPAAVGASRRQSFFAGASSQPPLILEDNEKSEIEDDFANNPEGSAADAANDGASSFSSPSKAGSEAPESSGSPKSQSAAALAALEGKAPAPIPSSTASMPPPPSQAGSGSGPGSWFSTGSSKPSGMRPLRLVQEKQEADEERKRQNRTSFMAGWFGGAGSAPAANKSPPSTAASAQPPSTPAPAVHRISLGSSDRPTTAGTQES